MDKELSVRSVRSLMASNGLSLRAACAQLGESPENVRRWERELSAPESAKNPGGRPAKWVLSEPDRWRLRWLVAATDSLPLAIERFVEWAQRGTCPLPVSRYCIGLNAALGTAPDAAGLAAHFAALMAQGRSRRWDNQIPKVIRQACALTRLERAELRGPRAANDEAFKRQRTMEVRVLNAEGVPVLQPIYAGMMFCSDDMSGNEIYATGQGLNRQTLCTHDVFSRKWLNLNLVGRRGDAYTLVDIADMFRAVITAVGLPFWWVLERGPWENDFVNGCAVPVGWCDREGMRWGGLDALFRIERKFLPQGKTIEGAFDYLQSRTAGHSMSVGRRRGINEHVSKLVERAKDGNEEALRYIWGAGEAAEVIWREMMADNAKPKRRAFLGDKPAVPNDLWAATFQRRELPQSDAWRLLPVKVCRVVRAQSIFVRLDGYGPLPYQFRMVGDDLPWRMVDNGTRVAVAFHPDKPELGAAVACMELRGSYNRKGWQLGEMLGTAPYVPAVPMADFTGEAGDFEHQRRARAAVRQEVRAGGMDHAGMVRVSRAADALGNALVMSNQPEAAAPVAAPARGPHRRVRSLAEIAQDYGDESEAAELPAAEPLSLPDLVPAGSAWDGIE